MEPEPPTPTWHVAQNTLMVAFADAQEHIAAQKSSSMPADELGEELMNQGRQVCRLQGLGDIYHMAMGAAATADEVLAWLGYDADQRASFGEDEEGRLGAAKAVGFGEYMYLQQAPLQ